MGSEHSLGGPWQPRANGRALAAPGIASKHPPRGATIGEIMGFMDDAKDAADATGKKIGEAVDDAKERVSDKVDEVQADAELKKAEAHKDAVDNKNEYKESLRES